ncbi:hypothetical protein [Nocardioides sp. B-3]|nr:hypothetical protein [Nocardioides sp. B-3]
MAVNSTRGNKDFDLGGSAVSGVLGLLDRRRLLRAARRGEG